MDKKMLGPGEVCNYVEEMGVTKSNNRFLQTLVLAFLAGMFISLGAFASQVASHSITNFGLAKLIAGIVFPIGLMFVVICGAELFTGNCLLSVAYAERRISIIDLLKNLLIVFIGNYIGAVFITLLIYFSGAFSLNDAALGGYILKVAYKKSTMGFGKAFASGVLCNVLVCLSVWGSYASKDIVGKIFMAFFPIMAFVITGFEHCVANMYYLTAGLLAKGTEEYIAASHLSLEQLSKIDISHIFSNLIPVTLGNFVGGGILIGLSYWFIYKYMNKKRA
ncbi:formate/nitrite transporter [Clostridium collagenovorans DSM 3089]|uniref:Formate/nitrite transporter n=1 Tax=Clostridium collagenovorans DSM 3089 TaxID=1121306 RepID=A0A1M5VXV9_9CLOT|nr:formate/nitrite transporter family protein [Clostridium collagenovorans]SHH80095.1 formate/nitrite transporter [Clostridium collagenovorans DSM 3089]